MKLLLPRTAQQVSKMGSNMSSVSLGFLVGAIPTVTMTLSSIAFTSIRVSLLVEAAFQNFAAGLILAAGVQQ